MNEVIVCLNCCRNYKFLTSFINLCTSKAAKQCIDLAASSVCSHKNCKTTYQKLLSVDNNLVGIRVLVNTTND